MTDPDPNDPLDRDPLDDSTVDKARDAADPEPGYSVLDRIGKATGSKPKISLRDGDPAGQTPMLEPLGPDDARAAGKYVVQGELGRGGVGAVHKGHDQDLGRDVAMKFLLEKHRNEPAILHRFVEEAQIGGQLQHPGIVPVYDLGMVDGKPFFTMKLVKGETLAKKLAERGSPSNDRRTFLSIFEDVCQTMAYAHARGVVHRDLKPANIMIGSFGEVQVVDWGMGKVLPAGGVADERLAVERQPQLSVIETRRSSGHGTQSVMGSVMGTPAYMPPEQAQGDVEHMDERSDVFALGAILCEILTGQPPYVGDHRQLIAMAAMAKLDDAHARLAACGAEADLVELATQCLVPAPAARPKSAEQLANAIHEHLAAAEQRAHDATVRTLALKRTQKMGISLTVVIAAGLAASLWFWRDADTQRGIAEQAATGEKAARELADSRAKEAAAARDAANANLVNFNRLSYVVRLENAKAQEKQLYPAWPDKAPSIRAWLDGGSKALVDALPELRSTLVALEARALPRTNEEAAAEQQAHPRAAELARLRGNFEALQLARGVRSGAKQPEAFALDDSKLPSTAPELNELAWPLVDPDRTTFGREAEGLALTRKALSLAPATGEDRAMVTDTLAWALFANGLDDDALEQSQAALAAAPDARRAEFRGYLRKLELAVDAASGAAAGTVIDELAEAVREIQAEVERRRTWAFADDADGFLHDTLRKLVADIEAFAKTEVGAVEQRLVWAERVEELTITRHREQWDEARLAILKADGVTASKLYGASPIELEPQFGLVPIGMNPATLLWEFYHLRSAWDGTSDPTTIAMPEHRADGSITVTGDIGIVFVLVPGGTFTMGAQEQDPNGPNFDPVALDAPLHEVTLSPFFLARHELTRGQWARLWDGDESLQWPSSYGVGAKLGGKVVTPANPIEHVDWPMSNGILTRQGLALPTEAQWEYGCRATTTTAWLCDLAELKDYANLADAAAKRRAAPWPCEAWSDGYVVHAPVGSFLANAFGLYDVHGNIWEWCQDTFGDYGSERPGDGLRLQGDGSATRMTRGGSFGTPAIYARSAYRSELAPTSRVNHLGLRPARLIRP